MKKLLEQEVMENNVYLQIQSLNDTDLLKLYYGLMTDNKDSWAVVVQQLIVERDIKNFYELIRIH